MKHTTTNIIYIKHYFKILHLYNNNFSTLKEKVCKFVMVIPIVGSHGFKISYNKQEKTRHNCVADMNQDLLVVRAYIKIKQKPTQ